MKLCFLTKFCILIESYHVSGTITRVKCFYLYLEEGWCINSALMQQVGGTVLVSVKKGNACFFVQSLFNWQIKMAIDKYSISSSAYRPYIGTVLNCSHFTMFISTFKCFMCNPCGWRAKLERATVTLKLYYWVCENGWGRHLASIELQNSR